MPYGISPGLTYADLRRMEHAFHIARRSRQPLNAFLVYAPPQDVSADTRSRLFSTYRGHLGQAFQRAGHDLIGLFVRERKADDENGAGEHLHGLVHAADDGVFELLRRTHGDCVKVQWNDGPRGDFSRLMYAQKQRTGDCEGLVKLHRRPHLEREMPAPIVGRRWSMSTQLEQLVRANSAWFEYPKNRKPTKAKGRKPLVAVEPPAPAKPTFTVIQGGQIEMFDAKPVARLHDYGGGLMPAAVAVEIRFHLKRLAMTQDDLARAALLGRPTITNALEGRFPLSEWAAARIRETLLSTAPAERRAG